MLLITLISCSEKQRSSIEVIKYDKNLVENIKAKFDSTKTRILKRDDFWTVEHYYIDSTKESKIMKDSLNNIVAIVIIENGVNVFAQEYYPNGQLIGKTDFPPGKVDGHATYYYKDGRIKSQGLWKNYRQVGKWEKYDKDGYLIEINEFDDNGEPL